jgi:hypothetical protein
MTLLFVGGSLHVDGDGAGLCLPSFRLIVEFTLRVRILLWHQWNPLMAVGFSH